MEKQCLVSLTLCIAVVAIAVAAIVWIVTGQFDPTTTPSDLTPGTF